MMGELVVSKSLRSHLFFPHFQEGLYFKPISNAGRRCCRICGDAADGVNGAVGAVAHFVLVSFAIWLSRFQQGTRMNFDFFLLRMSMVMIRFPTFRPPESECRRLSGRGRKSSKCNSNGCSRCRPPRPQLNRRRKLNKCVF